ncbi:MAG TPA: helix-turn-helix transcriptional regulator [Anaeromyxobacter sp.]|nr:helix-turn-helix transcriptional regulator [Anaeromyxobacter sp.]
MEPDSADRDDRLAAFSRWLARERELRGLSRDEVLRVTRLAPAVVEALEAGEPARLPPRAYVVGYLRAYAGAVGLDPDEVVLRWEEAAGDRGQGKGNPRRRAAPWIAAGVVLALVAAAAILSLRW